MSVNKIKTYSYKMINGEKKKVPKSKDLLNHQTCKGTKYWYFHVRYSLPDGTRKQYRSAMFATHEEACKAEAQFILTHDCKKKTNMSKKTLDDKFFEYMEENTKNKESSLYNYTSDYKNGIRPFFKGGEVLITEINVYWVKSWKKWVLEHNWTHAHNQRLFCVLSSILDKAVKDEELEENVVKKQGNFTARNDQVLERKKIRYQTPKQFEEYMSVVDKLIWQAFFNFAFWHGLRKGEQQALTWNDINFEKMTVTINKTLSDKVRGGGYKITNTKNRRDRCIALADQSLPYLYKLYDYYSKMDGFNSNWFVFGGIRFLAKTTIDNNLKKYYDRLIDSKSTDYEKKHVIRLTHHEFGRHSHASLLLNLGASYGDIALRLGDTEQVIIDTYAHPYNDIKNKQMRNMLSAANIENKINSIMY